MLLYPWPWPRIFFVSLALAVASSLVSSTPPLQLTVRYLQQSQHLTCNKTWPIGAAVYDIIIYDATPSTQYTQAAGSCIIITPY